VTVKEQLQRFFNPPSLELIILKSQGEKERMSRKTIGIMKIQTALEHCIVSNFLRLCEAEGVNAENANRELEMRLDALSQLELP
jgi:hypothetical protein